MGIYSNYITESTLPINEGLVFGDRLFDKLCEESTNFDKIVESINVLNENGIILEKVDFAKMWTTVKEKLINLWTRFADFIKGLVKKIKEFFTQKKLKDAEKELDQLKKDYKELLNKYGQSDINYELSRRLLAKSNAKNSDNNAKFTKLQSEYDRLSKNYDKLNDEHNKLNDEYNNAKESIAKVDKMKLDAIAAVANQDILFFNPGDLINDINKATRFGANSGGNDINWLIDAIEDAAKSNDYSRIARMTGDNKYVEDFDILSNKFKAYYKGYKGDKDINLGSGGHNHYIVNDFIRDMIEENKKNFSVDEITSKWNHNFILNYCTTALAYYESKANELINSIRKLDLYNKKLDNTGVPTDIKDKNNPKFFRDTKDNMVSGTQIYNAFYSVYKVLSNNAQAIAVLVRYEGQLVGALAGLNTVRSTFKTEE